MPCRVATPNCSRSSRGPWDHVIAHTPLLLAIIAFPWNNFVMESWLRYLIITSLSVAGIFGQNVGHADMTDLTGRNDPVLTHAIESWLDGDDRTSLPQLSALARKGNVAARLLLARIESNDRAPSEYILRLSREERLRMFRKARSGTPFFSSWIQVEAERGNELAITLNRASSPLVDLETIRNLIKAGEPQATEHLIKIASLYGTLDDHDRMAKEQLVIPELMPLYRGYINPPQRQGDGAQALRYIADRFSDTRQKVDIQDEQTRSAIMFLVWGTPYGEVSDTNRWRPVIERWLLESPEARPISKLCNAQCPDQPGQCALVMMSLLGGYFELIRFDSPLESIVSQDRFLNSARASMMVLRSAAQRRADHGGELLSTDQIAQRSSCLAASIETHRNSIAYML